MKLDLLEITYYGLCIFTLLIWDINMNEQRLLVVELLSISSEEGLINELCWSDELYPGEFDDFSICGLYSKEAREPVIPKLNAWKHDTPVEKSSHQPNHEALQVFVLLQNIYILKIT